MVSLTFLCISDGHISDCKTRRRIYGVIALVEFVGDVMFRFDCIWPTLSLLCDVSAI